jgi:hypothetical protein
VEKTLALSSISITGKKVLEFSKSNLSIFYLPPHILPMLASVSSDEPLYANFGIPTTFLP